jgi:hypothetical protein
VCALINDLWEAFFQEDVFQFFLQIIQILLGAGLEFIRNALTFFMDVILPFFNWLLGFVGGTLAQLIAFFEDVCDLF